MGRLRPALIVLAFLAALQGAAAQAQTPKVNDQAWRQYQQAVDACKNKNYAKAIELLNALIEKYPGQGRSLPSNGAFTDDYVPRYWRAVALAGLHKYDEATAEFNRFADWDKPNKPSKREESEFRQLNPQYAPPDAKPVPQPAPKPAAPPPPQPAPPPPQVASTAPPTPTPPAQREPPIGAPPVTTPAKPPEPDVSRPATGAATPMPPDTKKDAAATIPGATTAGPAPAANASPLPGDTEVKPLAKSGIAPRSIALALDGIRTLYDGGDLAASARALRDALQAGGTDLRPGAQAKIHGHLAVAYARQACMASGDDAGRLAQDALNEYKAAKSLDPAYALPQEVPNRARALLEPKRATPKK